MVAVLYVYAIFLIGLCIGTAFMGFSAFAITQRTMLLYLSAFALCYAFEQAIVFFNEFLAQNLPFRSFLRYGGSAGTYRDRRPTLSDALDGLSYLFRRPSANDAICSACALSHPLDCNVASPDE